MPKSAIASLAIALMGVLAFAIFGNKSNLAVDKSTYVQVGVAFFNTTAILSLLVLMGLAEKKTAAEFGKMMRNNSSTIVIALLVSLIYTGAEILQLFSSLSS